MDPVDRRKFLKIAGVSLGAGALYQVAAPAFGEGGPCQNTYGISAKAADTTARFTTNRSAR